MNTIGWIKLHRELLEWEWYDHVPTKVLFLHLLLLANVESNKYRGHEINIGSCVTGINALSHQTGLSVQQVRTAIKNLQSTNEITCEATNNFTIISIVKWKEYQSANTPNNKRITNKQQTDNIQITNDQQTDNKRITTLKEDNNKRSKEVLGGGYAFEGESYRLNEKDFEAFKKNCPRLNENQYCLALSNIDMAFKHGGSENWFFRLGNLLRIEQEKILKSETKSEGVHFL